MSASDKDLVSKMVKVRDERIAALEMAILDITYGSLCGSEVYIGYRENVDLSELHPIIKELHSR